MAIFYNFMGFARNVKNMDKQIMKIKQSLKTYSYLAILALLITPVLAACQPTTSTSVEESDGLSVIVSILPESYFAERIGGDWISVSVMVGPGQEPHTYEPTPDQMKTVSNAIVFFSIGVEYEDAWLPRFEDANPNMKVVDTSAGIQRIPMATSVITINEPAETEHKGELDPHVWLSPDNGKVIAENMLNALIELAPQYEAEFRTNYEDLISDIDTLNTQIEEILAGDQQRPFMVFHPAWGYFAKQYDLQQIAVQIGGQDPSASELADLVTIAKEKQIKVVFVQPSFSSASAEAIAKEIGGTVATANPLAEDWLDNLKNVSEAFAAALGN
jgi:zinc transport system substrate-binding protein